MPLGRKSGFQNKRLVSLVYHGCVGQYGTIRMAWAWSISSFCNNCGRMLKGGKGYKKMNSPIQSQGINCHGCGCGSHET